MSSKERVCLEGELQRLRTELEERRSNIPAHTIRPHQILALEALEEQIQEIRRKLGEEVP